MILKAKKNLNKEYNIMLSTQEYFYKERDAFLRFFGRLIESYSDILHDFIEYKFEFCERTWAGFSKIKTYTVKIFIYTVRKYKGDANYISTMFKDQCKDWCSIHEIIKVEETTSVTQGTKCNKCESPLEHSQFIWLECDKEFYCRAWANKNIDNFKTYHSNYFCREMWHGKHALLEISPSTKAEYLTTLIYKPNTTVPEMYFDEENVHGEELQTSTITDFWDFWSRAIKR